MKAILIKDNLIGFRGHAAHYKVDPPINDYENNPHKNVVLSTAYIFRPETYIFPCNENGDITDWGELPGSSKDITSHEEILTELGYQLV